jgi:hypothetical protein
MLKVWRNFSPRSLDFYKLAVRTMSTRLDLFQSIGLSEQKAKETLKNEALATHLENVVTAVSEYIVYLEFVLFTVMMCLGSFSQMLNMFVNGGSLVQCDRLNIAKSIVNL